MLKGWQKKDEKNWQRTCVNKIPYKRTVAIKLTTEII